MSARNADTNGKPRLGLRAPSLMDVVVLVFSLLAAVFCGLTWRETRGLSGAIERNRQSTPVISTISERLHTIEVDLAEIRGTLKERALEAARGGK